MTLLVARTVENSERTGDFMEIHYGELKRDVKLKNPGSRTLLARLPHGVQAGQTVLPEAYRRESTGLEEAKQRNASCEPCHARPAN